mgnify:CR=1 FL=1
MVFVQWFVIDLLMVVSEFACIVMVSNSLLKLVTCSFHLAGFVFSGPLQASPQWLVT